ncbi:hypothetical protein [Candidatus Methylacidiphilum infernorum]|nr:hypothetical protein [Candidatus Methylacidiphilum infernorum]
MKNLTIKRKYKPLRIPLCTRIAPAARLRLQQLRARYNLPVGEVIELLLLLHDKKINKNDLEKIEKGEKKFSAYHQE